MEVDSGFETGSTSELLTAIGLALTEIVAQNDLRDQGSQEPADLTFFHADFPPQISVLNYVHRLGAFCQCSSECYIIAVVLLDRFLAAAPYIRLSSLTAHRLIVTAVVLAVKGVDDAYYQNSYYAHVGGIPVRELTRMELTFLKVINFNLYVSPQVFEIFRDRLRWYLVDRAAGVSADNDLAWSSPSAPDVESSSGARAEADEDGSVESRMSTSPSTSSWGPCQTPPVATTVRDRTVGGSRAVLATDILAAPVEQPTLPTLPSVTLVNNGCGIIGAGDREQGGAGGEQSAWWERCRAPRPVVGPLIAPLPPTNRALPPSSRADAAAGSRGVRVVSADAQARWSPVVPDGSDPWTLAGTLSADPWGGEPIPPATSGGSVLRALSGGAVGAADELASSGVTCDVAAEMSWHTLQSAPPSPPLRGSETSVDSTPRASMMSLEEQQMSYLSLVDGRVG